MRSLLLVSALVLSGTAFVANKILELNMTFVESILESRQTTYRFARRCCDECLKLEAGKPFEEWHWLSQERYRAGKRVLEEYGE